MNKQSHHHTANVQYVPSHLPISNVNRSPHCPVPRWLETMRSGYRGRLRTLYYSA